MDDKTNQNKSPRDLEADIASTRGRISQNIDEISDRVNPQHLKDQAQETLAGAQEAVVGKVTDLGHTVGARAQEASSGLIDMVKNNPVPAALIGLGVGLLAAGGATVAGTSSSGSDTDRAYRGFDRGTGAADSDLYGVSSNDKLVGARALPRTDYTQGYAGGNTDKNYGGQNYGSQNDGGQNYGQTYGGQARGVAGWIEDHPLAVGAVTLLIGAAIGLSMPGTRYENEVMGEARDASFERAKSAVGDAVDVVKESASQATKAVKDELHERGASKEDVKEGVKAAAETVTSEVKDAAKNVVDTTKQKAEEAAKNKTDTNKADSNNA